MRSIYLIKKHQERLSLRLSENQDELKAIIGRQKINKKSTQDYGKKIKKNGIAHSTTVLSLRLSENQDNFHSPSNVNERTDLKSIKISKKINRKIAHSTGEKGSAEFQGRVKINQKWLSENQPNRLQ